MNVKVEDLGYSRLTLEEMLASLILEMSAFPFGGLYMAPYVSYIREILKDMPRSGYVSEKTIQTWIGYLLGVSLHFAAKALTESKGTSELFALSSLSMAEDLLQYVEMAEHLKGDLMMARAMKRTGYVSP